MPQAFTMYFLYIKTRGTFCALHWPCDFITWGAFFMPAYSTRGCMMHSLRYHEQLQLGAHVKWCYADELVPYGYGSDQLFAPFCSFDTFLFLSLSLPFKTSRSFLVVTWMFPVKCCALLNKAEIKFWWSIVLCFCQSSVQTVSIA